MELIGVIPAAGYGNRLHPLVASKETLPVGSQDVIINGKTCARPRVVSEYAIEQMAAAGVKKIFIITRPDKQDLLKQHMDGAKYDVDIAYIIGEPQSMVHSLDLSYKWVRYSQVVMSMPDTIALPVNGLAYLLNKHALWDAEISLGLYPTTNPSRFGMVAVDDNNTVTNHEDKPVHSTATEMWGIATWGPGFTERIHKHAQVDNKGKEIVFGDVIDESMKNRNSCKAFKIPGGQYYDIGTYEDYKKAIEEL